MVFDEKLRMEIGRWMDEISVPIALKNKIAKMDAAGVETELAECFAEDISFGTGGMRGLMGPGPARINECTIRRAAWGFAVHLLDNCHAAKQRGVVIAYDNRHNSREFALESAGVLLAQGIKTFVFPELMPTPVLSFAVRYLGAAGGIVVTASHNPPAYNGFKIYDEQGCQMTPEHTDAVARRINGITDYFIRDTIDCDKCEGLLALPEGVEQAYLHMIAKLHASLNIAHENAVADKPMKVVYSAQHGAGWRLVPLALRSAGYEVIEAAEQCVPDPDFSYTKSPNPEDAVSFELAYTYAEKNAADIILVTDPDCDRVGIAVRHGGEFLRLSGNQIGAVLLDYIMKKNTMAKPYVVTTIVTSDIGDAICGKYDVELIKTLTGFKYIGETIARKSMQDAQARFVLGFEESYGYLFDDSVRDKDAVQACVMLALVASEARGKGKSLIDVIEDIYREHGFFFDRLESIAFKGIAGMERMENFMEQMRRNCRDIFSADSLALVEDYQGGFAHILATEEQKRLELPQAEVLKLIFADGSWIVFRPSGTEPKLKIYACIRGGSMVAAEDRYELLRSRLVDGGLIDRG